MCNNIGSKKFDLNDPKKNKHGYVNRCCTEVGKQEKRPMEQFEFNQPLIKRRSFDEKIVPRVLNDIEIRQRLATGRALQSGTSVDKPWLAICNILHTSDGEVMRELGGRLSSAPGGTFLLAPT